MNKSLKKFEQISRLAGEFSLGAEEHEHRNHPFDERNIHPELYKVSLKLFDNGHYSQSTFEAFKYLDNKVKKISKQKDSGYKLMMSAFSENSPKIKLTALNNPSEIDEQMGYKHIFAGVMSAIRNPRGHDNIIDSIDTCLDHLSFASALLRRLENLIS